MGKIKSEHRIHSAMKVNGGVAQSSDKYDFRTATNGKKTVLQHDICKDEIPPEFLKADAVYTAMSLRAGYKSFTAHTVAEDTSFDQYCAGIGNTIRKLGKPAFVITNRTFMKKLGADRYVPIVFDLYGSDDICAIWNYDGEIPAHTLDLMKWIGKTFDTVLDFCCGYGEIAFYTKNTVLSDINTGCLEYIKEKIVNGETAKAD